VAFEPPGIYADRHRHRAPTPWQEIVKYTNAPFLTMVGLEMALFISPAALAG